MDQSAIQKIQNMALAAVTNDHILNRNVALVPEGYKLEQMEKFDQAPDRHRETFYTQYLSEFFNYAHKHGGKELTVFIDESTMSAKAIFDRSSPEQPSWQDHKEILKLEQTPELTELLNLSDVGLNQDKMIDFALDWKDNLTFFDGDNALTFSDAIGRLRKLKIRKSSQTESNRGDFKGSVSALEQIEIDAAGAPLPSHFIFTTEPYLEFSTRNYFGQIRALGDDNNPQLKYRLMGLPAIERSIAEEFKELIFRGVGDASIHIGTI